MAAVTAKTCVQCGEEFRRGGDEAVVDGECSFHLTNSTNRGVYSCCGGREACQRRQHRAEHHCDYAYAAFFERCQKIVNYSNTVDEWATVELEDPDDGAKQLASVGKLLRWTSNSALLGDSDEHLVVRVGPTLWHTAEGRYFFHVYSQQELDAVGQAAAAGAQSQLIFRSSGGDDGGDSYSQAEWLLTEQVVSGVRLTCKMASSEQPAVTVVQLSYVPRLQCTGVAVQSRAGIVERRAKNAPHALPSVAGNVAPYPDLLLQVRKRAARQDFTTADGIGGGALVMSVTQPLRVNDQSLLDGHDVFAWTLAVLNTAAEQPATLLALRVDYKPLNASDWHELPATAVLLDDSAALPAVLRPLDKLVIAGKLRLPLGDRPGLRPPWYRSYAARHRPLRLRFRLVDAQQRHAALLHEYVEPLPKLDAASADDGDSALRLFVDDVDSVSRTVATIRASSSASGDIVSGDVQLDVSAARKLVRRALVSGQTELPIDTHKQHLHAYALVDTACQSVYAVKLQLVGPSGLAQQGYLAVPPYGAAAEDDTAVVVGVPATEVATLPPPPSNLPSIADLFDDRDLGVDDLKPAAAQSAATSSSSSSAHAVDLARIEHAIDRLASQFETFNGHMQSLLNILAQQHH